MILSLSCWAESSAPEGDTSEEERKDEGDEGGVETSTGSPAAAAVWVVLAGAVKY